MKRDQIICSLDPAQLADWAALAVIRYRGEDERVGLPEMDLVNLWRGQGLSYPKLVENMVMVHEKLSKGNDVQWLVDVGGVGLAVADLMRREGLRPIGIQIHGGEESRFDALRRTFFVPKHSLVSSLNSAFQGGRLKIAQKIPLADVLLKEIAGLRAHLTAAGRMSFEATDPQKGVNDDLLFAVAQAVFAANSLWQPTLVDFSKALNRSVIKGAYKDLLAQADAKDVLARKKAYSVSRDEMADAAEMVLRNE